MPRRFVACKRTSEKWKDSCACFKLTLVDYARVELDNDCVADNVAEEAGGILAFALRSAAVFHGAGA
jgi:hypothetical protein